MTSRFHISNKFSKFQKINEDIRDSNTLLVGVQSETKFPGGEKRQIDIICECVKYALSFDPAIVHVKIYPIRIPAKTVQFYMNSVKRLFARVKNQQQPKSIGKWLNKLWYVPPVLYTEAVKMKLIYAHLHDKCTRCMDKWKKNCRAIWAQLF